MNSRYTSTAAENSPESIELSESERTSEEESTQTDFLNRRLIQALNYLSQGGGDDAPVKFMIRVKRINDALLQQLPQQMAAFDTTLYHRVRTMVRDVQREFENAAQDPTPLSDSDEDMLESYTPTAAEEALYRADDSSPSPTPGPVRAAPRPAAPRSSRPGSKNYEFERSFKYGGPQTVPEEWLKNHPGVQPFPETYLMAHWESLKIDHDLARSKENNVVETDVPFEHEQLRHYFHLPEYESGSRFRHPIVSNDVQEMVNKHATAIRLKGAVAAFNNGGGNDVVGGKYCPRVALEKFAVGGQSPPNVVSPSQIRGALASTPTKPRNLSTGSIGTAPSKRDSPALIEECLYDIDDTPDTREVSRTPFALLEPSSKANTISGPTPAGAAIRAFEKKVRLSSGAQAAAENIALAKTPSPVRTMTHVEIPKRPRSRPRKASLLSETSPIPDTPIETSLGKRKPSAGSQPYSAPKSSIKKSLRDTKRHKLTPAKSVGFVEAPAALEEDSEDPNYPASPVKRPVRVGTAGIRKAAVAGKQAGKKRASRASEKKAIAEDYEQEVGKGKDILKVAEGVKRGTTRSGAKFAV